GNKTTQNYDAAALLGLKRRALIDDPRNCFAISRSCIDESSRVITLGIIEDKSKILRKNVDVPFTKTAPDLKDSSFVNWEKGSLVLGKGIDEFKINKTFAVASQKTNFSINYDNKGLYIHAKAFENQMASLAPSTNGAIPEDGESFEIFLSTTGSNDVYYQFIINPNNVKKAQYSVGDQGFNRNYTSKWQTEVSKGSDSWSARMFIPWADLGGKPTVGNRWFVNFFRNRSVGTTKESYAWSPTGSLYNDIKFYGDLGFQQGEGSIDEPVVVIPTVLSLEQKDRTLLIFPNPTVSELHLSIDPIIEKSIVETSLINTQGETVYTAKGFKSIIPVSGYAQGIYYVILREGNKKIYSAKTMIVR
ncbi:MAG: T9SS type A sorting domain-containing protein, partial [Leadbetterella sp.]